MRITSIFDTTILSAVSKMDVIHSATSDKMDIGAASVWDFYRSMKKSERSLSNFLSDTIKNGAR